MPWLRERRFFVSCVLALVTAGQSDNAHDLGLIDQWLRRGHSC